MTKKSEVKVVEIEGKKQLVRETIDDGYPDDAGVDFEVDPQLAALAEARTFLPKEECAVCMETDNHDEPHYTDDWPHREGDTCSSGEHCTGCNPNNSSYVGRGGGEPANYVPEEEDEDTGGPVDLVLPNDPINAANLQVRGIHLKGTGLSFILGEANVNSIDIAQNQETGVMLIRVKFRGKRPARVFEVTPMDFISELAERSPLVIASSF